MRILKRLIIWTVVLLVVVAFAGYLTLRGSLPQLDGRMHVEHIRASVLIERDAAGIPVITAHDRIDLAFATGFVVALPLDRRNRLHRFRNRARATAVGLRSFDSELITAYAAGVNAGLESLSTWPFEYWLLRSSPQRWEPEDSLLIAYNMYLELNDDRANRDARRGLAHQVLSQPLLMEGRPRPAMQPPPATQLKAVAVGASPSGSKFTETSDNFIVGSNNWAVAGALTDSGHAIVANDMHLGITTPNVFYRARLVVNGDTPRDLNGVTLPGTPLLVAGSNGHVAWGNTNSYGDWTDAVIVRLGDAPETYVTPGGPRKFTTYRETINVKGGESEEMLVRETIWGPVLESDTDSNTLLAISWLAHKSEAVNLRGLDVELAASAEEALKIANESGMPPQNFVVGDAAGNIGRSISAHPEPGLATDLDSKRQGRRRRSAVENRRRWLRPGSAGTPDS